MSTTRRFLISASSTIGLLLALTGIGATLLGLTVHSYVETQVMDRATKVVPAAATMASALQTEIRNAAAGAARAADATATDEAAAKFVSKWKSLDLDQSASDSSSLPAKIGQFQTAYSSYRAAAASSVSPSAYHSLMELLVRLVYQSAMDAAPPKLVSLLSFLHVHLISVGSIVPAMGQAALFDKIGSYTSAPIAVSVIQTHRGGSTLAAFVSGELRTLHEDAISVLKAHTADIESAAVPRPLTMEDSTLTNVITELQLLSDRMLRETETLGKNSKKLPSEFYRNEIIILSIGLAICVICTVLAFIVIRTNSRFTLRWHTLVCEFEDTKATSELQQNFKGPIKDMTVPSGSIPLPKSELEVPFYQAAKLVQQLRPFAPQTLFGDYLTDSNDKPAESAATWSVLKEASRLDSGSAVVHCTVMLLAAAPPPEIGLGDGVALQKFYDGIITLVTSAVNSRGGVIHTVSSNCHITAVWGATHKVDNPAIQALDAAEKIEETAGEGAMLDINVCSGPCLMSNTKAGDSKYVVFFGRPFDLGEKIMALNRIHNVVIAIDATTFDTLGRTQQLLCKPIAVVHDITAVVIMSYHDSEPLKGERWKSYNTAFTMYRNGYLSEAIEQFTAYLASYPTDQCAKWLLNDVLIPHRKEIGLSSVYEEAVLSP